MVCGNTLFRPDIREHSALIEKPSAHRKSSRRISGQSESPPLRSGEVFQQTARGLSLPVTRIGLEAAPLSQWLHAKPVACVPGPEEPAEGTRSCIVKLGVLMRLVHG